MKPSWRNSAQHNHNHAHNHTMNPDPFNTHARTGHPVSARNRRRRSNLPAILAVILSLAASILAIMAIAENAR